VIEGSTYSYDDHVYQDVVLKCTFPFCRYAKIMSSVKPETGNFWKHLKKQCVYCKDYTDKLNGFKDSLARARAENKGR
jgi:hypothetical protein